MLWEMGWPTIIRIRGRDSNRKDALRNKDVIGNVSILLMCIAFI